MPSLSLTGPVSLTSPNPKYPVVKPTDGRGIIPCEPLGEKMTRSSGRVTQVRRRWPLLSDKANDDDVGALAVGPAHLALYAGPVNFRPSRA